MLQLTQNGLIELVSMLQSQATSLPAPTTPGCWLALFTSGPAYNGTGVELSSYSRLHLTSWTTTMAWPSYTVATAVDYTFTSLPTATVTGWGVYDDQSGGTLLAFETFVTPQAYVAGDTALVTAGTVALALST